MLDWFSGLELSTQAFLWIVPLLVLMVPLAPVLLLLNFIANIFN